MPEPGLLDRYVFLGGTVLGAGGFFLPPVTSHRDREPVELSSRSDRTPAGTAPPSAGETREEDDLTGSQSPCAPCLLPWTARSRIDQASIPDHNSHHHKKFLGSGRATLSRGPSPLIFRGSKSHSGPAHLEGLGGAGGALKLRERAGPRHVQVQRRGPRAAREPPPGRMARG